LRAPPYSEISDELFLAASIDDPHALYARLRAERPISRVAETGVHLVATWDLIQDALGREEDFSANITGVLMRDEVGEPSIFELPQNAASQVIATADDPSHAVHRALAQPQLTPGQTQKLEAPIRRWTQDRMRSWLQAGAGDFVPIAEGIPARVVAEVLGLPDGDVTKFRAWAMTGGDILAGDVDHARLVALAGVTHQMSQYLGEHFDRAYAQQRDGADAPLLHALARGVERGEIVRDEAIGIAAVMFGAGGESTAALIGSAVRWLAEDPELADELRRSPERIANFVEEVARLEPPFKFHYRAVRKRCELGGYRLAPGDRLMLLWASANRDPAHIEDPDTMRLDRRHPKNHLSFGRGKHFCIGAPIARLEARTICEELLGRTSAFALRAGAPPRYTPSIFIRRLERLVLDAQPTGT
jgi:cytochrome P450